MQDLWADFADEARPTAEAGRGKGLRQRRLSEQAVLAALRAWLLEEYLLPYGTSLGATRIFQHCYWLDGLGNTRAAAHMPSFPEQEAITATGAQQAQRTTTRTSLLPPALQPVAATAHQLAHLERPITLHGLLLAEKRGKRGGTLAEQTHNGTPARTPLTLPKQGGVLPANWPELARAGALLTALQQSAAVFLLNPLQDGLFRYADLAPLYQRTAPTELFLWLPHKQIASSLLPSLRTADGAAALTNLLRSDQWKALVAHEDGKLATFISGLVKLLMESMRGHFLTVQHLGFSMCSGPALVESVPASLLFATRRQDSLYSLNDAVCLRERRLRAESEQGVLNEAWFAVQREKEASARWERLVQQTLAVGRAQRTRRWPDLRQQLLLASFGQHTLHEYDQCIAHLLARGAVRCEWRQPTRADGETSVPANDDLLRWS